MAKQAGPVKDRVFDPEKEYSEVLGMSGYKFLQEGVYYDPHHKPIKYQEGYLSKQQRWALEKLHGPKKKVLGAQPKKKGRSGRPKGSKVVDGKLVSPDKDKSGGLSLDDFAAPPALSDSEIENLKAQQAEEKAG